MINKIIFFWIPIAFLIFIPVYHAQQSLVVENSHSMLNHPSKTTSFTPRSLSIIQYPLFTCPALVYPNSQLNISLKLPINENVTAISLFGEQNISSTFSWHFNALENTTCDVQFYIPATTPLGLYSLLIDTTNGSDWTYHSVKILPLELPLVNLFVHVTDSHVSVADPTRLETLNNFVVQINQMSPLPEFIIFTGDLIEGVPNANASMEYLETLTALSNLSVPLFVVNGNHDLFGGISLWEEFFGTQYQYSFDYGPLHFSFTSLKSDVDSLPKEELSWLAADLSAHSSSLTIFSYHTDYTNQFVNIDAKIRLIGHSHTSFDNYENGRLRLVTGNLYNVNEFEPGEYRVLRIFNSSEVAFPIININTGILEFTSTITFTSAITSSASSSQIYSSQPLTTSSFDLLVYVSSTIIILYSRKDIKKAEKQ